MDDSAFKHKYKKYKCVVKVWENKFRKEKGRIPSKYDIREAPVDIRAAYKMYYKLKTTLLEDTLSEVLSEDGFDILDNSQNESVHSENFDSCSNFNTEDDQTTEAKLSELELPQSFSNPTHNTKKEKLTDFEAVETNPINEKAWRNVPTKKLESKLKSPTKPMLKLNAKLFANKSFSLRNPRKKLSRTDLNKTPSSPSLGAGETKQTLPDFETILMEKARAMKSKEAALPEMLSKPKTIISNFNKGWLDRCVPSESNTKTKIDSTNGSEAFGISNINIDVIKRSFAATNNSKPIEKTTSLTFPEITLENQENFSAIKTVYAKNTYVSDSDSVVSNSEDELASNKDSTIRHIIKKRKVFDVIDKNVQVSKEKQTTKMEVTTLTAKQATKTEVTTTLTAKEDAELEKDLNEVLNNEGNNETTNLESVKKTLEKKDNNVKKKSKQQKPNIAKIKQSNKNKKNGKAVTVQNKKLSSRNRKNVSYHETSSSEEEQAIEKDSSFQDVNDTPAKSRKASVKKERPAKTKGKVLKNERNKKTNRKKVKLSHDESHETVEVNPEDLKNSIVLSLDRITSLPRVDTKELEQAETMVQKYVIGDDNSKKNTKSGALDDPGESTSKKLSKSKNLNENFVRLNLRKKIFVRGKKPMNYSRYKKTMWKQKKAQALSGPDMDMRGCDGGMLTCFKCGKTGHFARNCKFKDDELLSMDAVDESPFPTLEEAEDMAHQKALSAHSRNVDKLPESSNALIYKTIKEDDVSKSDADEKEENLETLLHENASEEVFDNSHCIGEETGTDRKTVRSDISKVYIGHKIPEDFLKKSGILELTVGNKDKIEPLYSCKEDGTVIDATDEVYTTLRMFGHTDFRKGQDRAIMRILSGVSTLVTLNTGSGKSLCYQLPAYLYSRKRKCITLVISPLVSLMEDQVHGVPSFINAQCLHTNQTPQQKEKIMEMVKQGDLDILLVSPEAIVAGERSTGFGSLLRQLPPIAFACIDEVHCVSQWSHNFRPSYLMICKVLKQKLGVKTILGLTATATVATKMSIVKHVGIPDGLGSIISDSTLPENLILSASKDQNRDHALINLLRSDRFAECQSIIVYCTRRDECERVAGFIRTCFQDTKPITSDSKKRKRVNWNAEPYHAGMPSSRRKTIQKAFMKNEMRIVVATIAFGMGINKPDIRGIIHYNMPKSFESYVQEVGRAGRDGKVAHCHLFLDSKGSDQNELRRFIYANSIDRHVIRKLLQNIFIPCSCRKNLKKNDFVEEHIDEIKAAESINWNEIFEDKPSNESYPKRICPGHEVGFSVEKTVEALDIPEENISTLLCYLELDGRWNVNVLSNAYVMSKIISYSGSRTLKHAAKECPPLAMAIAIELKKGSIDENSTCVEFSIIEVASAIGWDSGVVKYQLKNLEWTTVNGLPKRSALTVTFFDLGFRVRAPGDLTDDELDNTLDVLYKRSVKQETSQLLQLSCIFKGLSSVAFRSYIPCESKVVSTESSDKLKLIIQDYFQNDIPKDIEIERTVDETRDNIILDDVRSMINMYPENNFTGRTLARIFHGIQSPNYPAVIWGRCKYWRAHTKVDFNHIVRIANTIIVKMRT